MNDELHLLMRYCDSEVESVERVHVALRLLRDVEQRRTLDEWRMVGDAVRLLARAPAEKSDSIEDGVMSRIAAFERPPVAPTLGFHWHSAPRFALVAGFLLAVGFGVDRQVDSTVLQGVTQPGPGRLPVDTAGQVDGPTARSAANERRPALAIERVDLGGRSGAIFLVSVGDTETPVVWLNDDEQGGRMLNL